MHYLTAEAQIFVLYQTTPGRRTAPKRISGTEMAILARSSPGPILLHLIAMSRNGGAAF
jgi:hypothetical protein